ncbi:MAG: OsmC family peroxiredoxin, partial [Mailhella sp.]|nr:OsmC family peroxiredoxin [Mailhella sp.]
MSQIVKVSLERKGKVFDLDTQCLALGKIHVDPDMLPENERSGTAKRMLGASVLYCFVGSFADALQARGAA